MAVVVSVANNCEYCQIHHAQALNHYWKSDEKIKALRNSFTFQGISERERVMINYARKLTLETKESASDPLDHLKGAGLSDNAILDATLVISYFNFVNRMVLSLGVQVEEDKGEGYKY